MGVKLKRKKMGLSNHLGDLSSGSIPILLITVAAGLLSFIRSLHFHRPAAAAASSSFAAGCLAKLITLVEQLITCRPFTYFSDGEEVAVCVVCLCGMRAGEKVQRLACCHQFHSKCLDGWIGGSNPSCPLCRSPMVAEERSAAVGFHPTTI